MILLFFLGIALMWAPVLFAAVNPSLSIVTAQRIGKVTLWPGILCMGYALYAGLHPTTPVDYIGGSAVVLMLTPGMSSILWILVALVCAFIGSAG